ncbi:hypothetical protein CYMTET_12843 [Cymbomonas tetramitiformis]|uniref:Uncharacterized protein n=1 Tax=Cymbomonas tetramitiformis TaxID=36881 RepID=A0AAE0GKV9_9CHLO|nr:hypothetical protein CYMTET_12843 [Cymbomonas tetramitiformis]
MMLSSTSTSSHRQESPAGPNEDPVLTPGPAVEADMAPAVDIEIEREDALAEHAGIELERAVPTGGMASESVTQTSPDTWRSPEEPGRVRASTRWPALREDIREETYSSGVTRM